MNKIVLKGNITKEIELMQTQSGKSVLSFSIAVNRKAKSGGVDFFDCVAWEKTAEFIARYFEKGEPILISGEMHQESYQTKTGEQRVAWKVTVSEAEFCGAKREREDSVRGEMPAPSFDSATSGFETLEEDSDLPF